MNEDDFPSLYLDANRVSIETQSRFTFSTKVVVIASLTTGFIGNMSTSKVAIIAQIVCALAVLTSACYLLFGKPQRIWYATRALAESIKTISWRYATRADPFNGDDTQASIKFRTSVAEFLRANSEASALRFDSTHTHLITKKMNDLRDSKLDKRKHDYLKFRIDDQLRWYRNKSKWNDKRSRFWYSALIIFSLLALIISLLRIDYEVPIQVDWIFSVPIAVLTWVQVKRYQELASSYSLTAHEIVFAKNEIAQLDDEEKNFSDFVGNTENAFSREHTQWYARKDLN